MDPDPDSLQVDSALRHGFNVPTKWTLVLQDLHVLDIASMSWVEPPTGGLPPGPLYGHTAVAVGRRISLLDQVFSLLLIPSY